MTPSLTQEITGYNYISSMDPVFSPVKPVVDKNLTPRYGNQSITGLMGMISGGMNPVPGLYYQHFEEDWINDIVEVVGQAAGAAGAAVTFTVAAAYQWTFPGSAGTTAQAPYIVGAQGGIPLSGGTTNPVRVQDVLLIPDGAGGAVEALVTAATGTTFTCYPTVTATAIPATVTNVTQIVISGNGWGEGTDQPLGRNTSLIRYTNNAQIFKGTAAATGSAMGVQMWIQVPDKTGVLGWAWYLKNQKDQRTLFLNEEEVQLVTGQKLSNATLAVLQPTTVKTEGLIPFIQNYGNPFSFSAIAGVQLSDYENMIVVLNSNRGAMENTCWEGIVYTQARERFMRDTMKNGAISYGTFEGMNREKAISFGFSSFELSGYTFHCKTYDLFNHPKYLGAAQFSYKNSAMIIPSGQVAASFRPGAKATEMVPSLRMNYVKLGQYSRELEEWITGGANGIYNQTLDQLQYNLRSHKGFEGFGANRYVYMTGK